MWRFTLREFFPKLTRLYPNRPLVKLPSTASGITPAPTPKDCFFDGGTGLYQDVANNKAYVFISARRGGRLIYALDVSATSAADLHAPKFMWKKGCPNMTDNV